MLVDYSGGGQIAEARQSLRPRQATRPLPVEIATRIRDPCDILPCRSEGRWCDARHAHD
jgi:hypothetical protein